MKWIHDVKQRYITTQIKAAVKVNTEQLYFNWQLGRDLVERKVEEKWGKGIVEQLSLDLQNEFPDAKGFSPRNLWNMKKWYLFYSSRLQVYNEIISENQVIVSENLQIRNIDRFYASSQLCSACGYQNTDTRDLSVRKWICPKCGQCMTEI